MDLSVRYATELGWNSHDIEVAKIIEKVVDDVYEVEEPVEESSEAKGALIGTLALLANSNISEGLFEQIVEIIKKSKENK